MSEEKTTQAEPELESEQLNSEQQNSEQLNSEQQSAEPEAELVEEAAEQEEAGATDEAFEALQQDLAQAREDVLRAQAEMQNLRRRTERDVENAHKFALEKFVKELLPVVDNLERALAAHDGEPLEGVELTLKGLIEVLKRFSVETVDPAGEPFDPELHQAMSMVPNPDMENNTVLEVFQKGYTLSGRLVRPAMVVVVKN